MAQPKDWFVETLDLTSRLARLATAADFHLRYPDDRTEARLRELVNVELKDIPGALPLDKAS